VAAHPTLLLSCNSCSPFCNSQLAAAACKVVRAYGLCSRQNRHICCAVVAWHTQKHTHTYTHTQTHTNTHKRLHTHVFPHLCICSLDFYGVRASAHALCHLHVCCHASHQGGCNLRGGNAHCVGVVVVVVVLLATANSS